MRFKIETRSTCGCDRSEPFIWDLERLQEAFRGDPWIAEFFQRGGTILELERHGTHTRIQLLPAEILQKLLTITVGSEASFDAPAEYFFADEPELRWMQAGVLDENFKCLSYWTIEGGCIEVRLAEA